MRAVLAIDQGTTGSTCLVLDEKGRLIGRAYSEFTQHYPKPGWVEHDAVEIWDVTQRTARAAVDAARASGAVEIAGIGITNQRETVVLWDRETGEPVHRAIVWQDRRTAARCRELREQGREEWVRERTGLVIDPYFSGTKLEWLLASDAKLRERAESGELAAGTIDSWLLWNLTGGAVHATDVDPVTGAQPELLGASCGTGCAIAAWQSHKQAIASSMYFAMPIIRSMAPGRRCVIFGPPSPKGGR